MAYHCIQLCTVCYRKKFLILEDRARNEKEDKEERITIDTFTEELNLKGYLLEVGQLVQGRKKARRCEDVYCTWSAKSN